MTFRTCIINGCDNPARGLQCGRKDCARFKRHEAPERSNSASVGGELQGEGAVESTRLSSGRQVPEYGVVLEVTPMGKPRQTQRDKWKQRPVVVRYRQFCDDLRAEAERLGFTMPESGAELRFNLPMPKSWTKKKKRRMDGQPHQQKPDIDNLEKALLDALLPDGDERVWHIAGKEKRWARTGSIEVYVEAMGEQAA